MPYSQRRSSNANTSVRVTGLFPTKRRGLFVGGIEFNQLTESGFIALLKDAMSQKKGLTFFLWKQTKDEGPEYALTVDVARDRPERTDRDNNRGSDNGGGATRRQRIERDDDDDFAENKSATLNRKSTSDDFPF